MGYRSEVAVRLELPKGMSSSFMMQKIVEAIGGEVNNMFEHYKIETIATDVECITLYDSYIKWYSLYSDVIAFNNLLQWFEGLIEENNLQTMNGSKQFYVEDVDYNFEGAYHFVRIGEDLNDIEEKTVGNLWDWIHIVREIRIDF